MKSDGRVGWPAALLLALVASGCGRADNPPSAGEPTSPPAAPRAALQPVSPPDLGTAEAALRERVQSTYASLAVARDRAGTSDTDLASAYGQVGKLLIAAELLQQAAPYLANAQALDPAQLAWPYYRAHVHRLRNERDQAVLFFEQALARQPDHVPSLVWLGAVHLDRGDAAAAVPLFTRAVTRQPTSAAAHFGLGRAAVLSGDQAGAARHFEAALAADPRATRVHYPLAMAYRALGDARADAHMRQWQQAFSPADSLNDVQIYPADPLMEEIGSILDTAVAFEMRGTRALDDRRWPEAIAQFRDGLKVAPRDATLHQNLGTALYLSGSEEQGRVEFEEAARLSPGYGKPQFSLGLILETRGNDQEAIVRYATAIQLDPSLVDARFRLADTLRRSGRADAALQHYQAILAADPRASQARFGQAMALVRLRRYAEARAALEAAATLHADQPGFAHALARLLASAPDDAMRDGRRALQLAQSLSNTYGATAGLLETTAMALAEVGRFADAVTMQRSAMAAIAAQGRSEAPAALADNLRRYEASMPCRMPWRDDDPVHTPARPSGLGL